MRIPVAFIAVLVLSGGCKRSSPHRAAVDRYVNVEMRQNWAHLWSAMRPFETMTADALIDHPEWIPGAMTGARSHLVAFLDGVATIAPPPPMQTSHAALVAIAKEYVAIADEMAASLGPPAEPARFAAALARAKQTNDEYTRWQNAFDRILRDQRVGMNDVAHLPLPDAEPEPMHCGKDPCPCAERSEVKRGDALASCTLAEPVGVGQWSCAPGPIAFHDDGSLAGCTLAGELGIYGPGPITLDRDGKVRTAISQVYAPAAPDKPIICGPGPVRQFADGSYEACTVVGDARLATIEIPKQVTAEVVFHRGGTPRYVKYDGKETCFDETGQLVAPCVVPTSD